MNLASSVATSSSSVNSPIASRSPGILKASSRQVRLSGRPDASTDQMSNPNTASSSHGWQKGMLNCSSTQGNLWQRASKDQKSLNRQEESVISTGELVATEHQGCSGNPEIPGDFGRIISVYHKTLYFTWRKSSPSQDRFMIGNRRII